MGEFPSCYCAHGRVLTRNSKNVRVKMGRCPVRSMFPEALAVLAKNQDKFRSVARVSV
jgi:hypothetical protein